MSNPAPKPPRPSRAAAAVASTRVRRTAAAAKDAAEDSDDSFDVDDEVIEASDEEEVIAMPTRGKKRAASRSNDVTARSSKRGRATASGSERLEDGGTKTKMKDGFSRLERLVQLESRAEAEGAGRGGRDDDEEGYDDERGQTRSGRASGRRSTRDRSRSLSRNPRRGGANDDGGDDDDKFGDDDDELESDDDYGQGANFDDDEGYDDDVGDGNAEAYF